MERLYWHCAAPSHACQHSSPQRQADFQLATLLMQVFHLQADQPGH